MGTSPPHPELDASDARNGFLLSHLLDITAHRVPDRVALRYLGDEITYRELASRVAKLAGALVANGVKPGDRVGIHLHMSMETMVAAHAILRAGAAYVPLDAMSPVSVLARIVDDCGIAAIVTNTNRATSANELARSCSGLQLLVGLDDLDEGVQTEAGARSLSWNAVADAKPIEPVPVLADDLAYVIYTSGSTGEPKGIMHTHRSGLSYARLSAELYGVTETDRLANFAPLHFDISTFAFFVGPATGACVVLLSEPHLKMPASLCTHLAEEACTILYAVSSMYMQMLGRGGLDTLDFASVRWLKFAGEVMPSATAAQLMEVFPNATFSNVYGPTETNQCTFYHFSEPPDPQAEIPIGVAWPDTEVRVVGPDGQEIQDATKPVNGELVVRTSTMMQGYWNRPDLDAGVFDRTVAPGGRTLQWFRTGDLVEVDVAGALTFLGRRDHQVKVRGHRLELESVESALGSLPKVVHAVAGLRGAGNGEDELVAAVVLEADVVFDAADFRRRLAEQLAPYAIPSAIFQVDDFPRTPSGKIDRRTIRLGFRTERHNP